MRRHSSILLCLFALSACATTSAPEPVSAPAVVPSVDAKVEALLQRADSLYSAGRFDEAIPAYEQVVQLAPQDLRLYEPLAYNYAKLGLFDEAEEWLRARRELSDDPAYDHCLMADVAVRRGELESARLHMDSLIALMGEDPEWSIASCASEIDMQLGEHERAKRRLEQAVAELRRQGEPLHGLTMLAFFALQDGEVERAEALLEEHEMLVQEKLAQDENIGTSHLDLAAIEALRGQPDAAVHHLKLALEHGGWGEYWGGYYWLTIDPILASLHGHPQYERLMTEVKADLETMRTRVLTSGAEAPRLRAGEESLRDTLLVMDSLIFAATFHGCDPAQAEELLTEDVEFYHDQGGFVSASRQQWLSALEERECSDPPTMQRRLIEETMEVDRIGDYGALQMARHQFHVRQEDGTYQLNETARFIHLWKRDQEGGWRLARVISFDHREVQ